MHNLHAQVKGKIGGGRDCGYGKDARDLFYPLPSETMNISEMLFGASRMPEIKKIRAKNFHVRIKYEGK